MCLHMSFVAIPFLTRKSSFYLFRLPPPHCSSHSLNWVPLVSSFIVDLSRLLFMPLRVWSFSFCAINFVIYHALSLFILRSLYHVYYLNLYAFLFRFLTIISYGLTPLVFFLSLSLSGSIFLYRSLTRFPALIVISLHLF